MCFEGLSISEEPGIVYNICENNTECCDASWKGVYENGRH